MRIDDPKVIGEIEDVAGVVIDWDSKPVKRKAVTSGLTFTDANLPAGINSGIIELHLDDDGLGPWTIIFPAYWDLKGSGVYTDGVSNMIVITCVDGTPASEIVKYQIISDV